MNRRIVSLLLGLSVLTGFFVAAPQPSAEALDVYTEPGTHRLNGRLWRTSCGKYSSTVDRCRTEIQATTISYANGRYVERFGWAFNNLTYKPSPRAQWVGNILATPGEHLSAGRRWKTECDTAWTGSRACRSSILTTTYRRSGGGYVQSSAWVFNNIVHFTDSPDMSFCEPPAAASAGLGDGSSDAKSPSPDPAGTGPEGPALPATPMAPTADPPEPSPSTAADPAASEPGDPPDPHDEVADDPQLPASPTPDPPSGGQQIGAAASTSVTLGAIQHPGYPTGVLYDRLGAIRVDGRATNAASVRVELLDSAGKVRSSATAEVSVTGAYTASIAGGFAGKASIRATAGSATVEREVELRRAGIAQSTPASIDPLATTQITGTLTPALGDTLVTAYVSTSAGWVPAGSARTLAGGTFAIPLAHGKGSLGTWQVRTCAVTAWGASIPAATASTMTRARVANVVITDTTAAEVATTYRAGCPVGPSGLSTIRINQQSMDAHVYRGEIIVRRERAADVAKVFTKTFEGGFPVFQMTNLNAFKGDDVASMAANNTSAFNCRKVVGNPYALSPHSYGYAVDLNPWQNPYRDPQGRWYPSTDHVSRTPVVPGMLTSSSVPVVQFKALGWEWFSGWDWHHFEKR